MMFNQGGPAVPQEETETDMAEFLAHHGNVADKVYSMFEAWSHKKSSPKYRDVDEHLARAASEFRAALADFTRETHSDYRLESQTDETPEIDEDREEGSKEESPFPIRPKRSGDSHSED